MGVIFLSSKCASPRPCPSFPSAKQACPGPTKSTSLPSRMNPQGCSARPHLIQPAASSAAASIHPDAPSSSPPQRQARQAARTCSIDRPSIVHRHNKNKLCLRSRSRAGLPWIHASSSRKSRTKKEGDAAAKQPCRATLKRCQKRKILEPGRT